MFGKAPGGAGEIPPVCPDFLIVPDKGTIGTHPVMMDYTTNASCYVTIYPGLKSF